MITHWIVSTSTLSHVILFIYMTSRVAGDCPTPPVYQDKTHTNYDAQYSTGDTARYECSPGYDFTSGQKISTCQSDGSWSQVTLECERGSCSNPGTPNRGTRSGDDFRVNKQVTFSCDEGYRLQGDTISTCLTDRTWSNSVPRCDAITCPGLQAPQDGKIDPPGEARYNDIVTVTCVRNGYMYSETPNTRRCTENGWTGTQGTCTETDCGLPALYNGEVEAPVGTAYAAQIRYSCNAGTTMEMSDDLKSADGYSRCYDTGKWAPGPPTCNLNCGRDVPDVTLGSISSSGSPPYPHKKVLAIECNPGHRHKGANHVTCTNGTWTPNVDLTCEEGSAYIWMTVVIVGFLIVSIILFFIWIWRVWNNREKLQVWGYKQEERYWNDVYAKVKKSPMPNEMKSLYKDLGELIKDAVLVDKEQNTERVTAFSVKINAFLQEIYASEVPEEEADLRDVYEQMYKLTTYDLKWVEKEKCVDHMEKTRQSWWDNEKSNIMNKLKKRRGDHNRALAFFGSMEEIHVALTKYVKAFHLKGLLSDDPELDWKRRYFDLGMICCWKTISKKHDSEPTSAEKEKHNQPTIPDTYVNMKGTETETAPLRGASAEASV